jgi:hypothetical protein
VLIGSSSELNSSYLFQSNGSAIFNGNIAIPTTTSTVGSILVNGQRAAHFYNSGTFLGIQAGNYTQSGIQNTGIGQLALRSVTSGSYNSAFGYSASELTTTGYENTAFSRFALGSNTSGNQNVAIGNTAMYANLGGSANTAIGYDALRLPTASNYNTAVGYMAMNSAGASVTNNTALGSTAGFSASGSGNVFIGYASGSNATESNALYIDNSNTSSPLISGDFSSNRVGINTSVSSISRTLHVTGEVRITDLTTDPPTRIVGADADGDLGELALSGLSISSGTLTATDASATNEAQTLSVSGTTSGIISLNAISGTGGGTATIAAGTGISVAQSGGTITITNSSPATAGWLIDGNTIAATRRIGSNDNFDVVVETNNTDRMWFDNAGTVSIGATQLTTAQLNINGFGTTGGTGMLIAGGASLTGPTFYSATGSGSGSNATVLSGVVNMLNGNVEALIQNTATTGTGGALLTLNTHQSATGDPKVVYTTNGTTTWAEGIDNSISGEPWKLTANSDIGAATPAISATTANKVGVNQAAALVTLQVSGTDAVGLPSGTIAQRSAAAIPQIRHNNTFSGFEFYDPNKNLWYRLTGVSSPSVATSAAAGTGATAGLVFGASGNDVRGAIELTTGSASLAVGTVVNVTYSNPYSGTATNVILTPKNDAATSEVAKWRVTNETQNGFSIRAVTALTASTTYQFNYSVGQ